MNPNPDKRLCFGPFEADIRAAELRKDGELVRLQEQPFRLLVLLLERPGEVVTRDEIREALWSADEYVEFEHSLNTAVNRLRTALGDSASEPVYIETVPRRGYRFVGEIEGPRSHCDRARSGWRSQRRRWMLGAIAVAAIALAALWIFWGDGEIPKEAEVVAVSQPVPLTSLPGEERGPTFSPDGAEVAFTRRRESERAYNIWIKPVGGDVARQLTGDPADEYGAAWSPDGTTVAFLRRGPESLADIVLVSSQGGAERIVGHIVDGFHRFNLKRLTWSPNGSYLLVNDDETRGVHRVSLETGRIELVRDAEGSVVHGRLPVYSSDGKGIAYFRDFFEPSIEVFFPATGQKRELGKLTGRGLGLAWMAGNEALVAAEPLTFVPLDGRGPRPLAGLSMGRDVAYSPAARRLVFSRYVDSYNNWLIDIQDHEEPPRRFAASTAMDGNPTFSADGRRVAFTSSRDGKSAVWVAEFADGATLRVGGSSAGSPRWAPDGSEIAFDAPGAGTYDVYAVPSFGGAPRLVAASGFRDTVPSYSRDGEWIYFASDRSGDFQVWKVPVAGEKANPGSALQVTRGGGFLALESSDGQFVYYAKQQNLLAGPNAIWRIPAGGGPEEPIVPALHSNWGNWGLAGGHLYFINRDESPSAPSDWAVYKLDVVSRETVRVSSLQHEPGLAGPAFDVSPDGRWILYGANDSNESDLMLVEDFP